MEAQQIYDTVLYGLRAQGKASVQQNSSYGCAYRSDDGCRCAAGLLIPDEAYSPDMEGKTIRTVLLSFPGLDDLRPHLCLIDRLQDAHDRKLTRSVREWEIDMGEAAAELSLVYTPVSAAILPTVDTFGGEQ